MGKHLVLAGGGHAHMVTLSNLDQFIEKGHTVTVIQPSAHHYYSGMGPGMLGKTYTSKEIRFATKQVVEQKGGRFILDRVARVDADQKTVFMASGNSLSYDVLSFNTGSYVSTDIVKPDLTSGVTDIFTVKPIETLMAAQKRVLELTNQHEITVSVVGGGPAGVEIAGSIWRLAKDHGTFPPVIRMFAGTRFMARFPESVRGKIWASLTGRGIDIIEQGHVQEIETGRLTLVSGQKYETDLIFMAPGVLPSPVFKNSGLPTGPDGGLWVNEFLQCPKYPELFGGGDCIYFEKQPLDKVGVYAVRENPVLFHNIMAALDGQSLHPFDPGGDYLLIFNLGNDTGVLHKWGLTFGGKAAFFLKDRIDRKFMQKFQAIENRY